jgi:uncharacterized protein (TIGR03083 family)
MVIERTVSELAEAGKWYLEAVDALPPNAWTKPTLCEAWNVSQVVAHLTTGDQLFRGLILDATGKDRTGEDLPKDFPDRMRRFDIYSTWEPAKLKPAAHKASELMIAALAEGLDKNPQALVTAPFGTVPLPVLQSRRVNEYVIHGYDLMPAIGRSIPIPSWFIDRVLGESVAMLAARMHQRSPHKGRSASFHMHRTDGEGEWMLRVEGGQVTVEAGHGKADVAFRGPGEGLYWVYMGRGKPEDLGVEVHGDPALAADFKEWFPGP